MLHKDLDLDVILNDFNEEEPDEDIISRILSQAVDVISFSTYVWNVERVLTICDKLGKQNALVVLGGPGASYTADEVLKEHDHIDVIVLGEGEETLYRLLERLKAKAFDFHDIPNLAYRDETGCCKTQQTDPLSLEIHDYPLDTSAWQDCARICYETSRGCVMKCKFCLWYKGGGNRLRFYPMKKVKSDLSSVFELPALEMLKFVDADINMNRKRALEIFRYIRGLNDQREKRGMNRVFILCESNPEMLNEEIIREMAKHDRIMDFGLQTIDEELNRSMGRIFHRERFFANLEKLVREPSDRYGEYMLEVIYGLPGDTLQGFRDTISFILSLPYLMYFWCFRFLMMPGTLFHEEAEQFDAVFNPKPPYELIRSNTWSEEDLEQARFLSFHFALIQYGLPEVFDAVRTQVRDARLDAFEAIFEHISENYSEVENLYNEWCGPGREVYQFQRCTAFSSDPSYDELRRSITQDSLAVIRSLAQAAAFSEAGG